MELLLTFIGTFADLWYENYDERTYCCASYVWEETDKHRNKQI